MEPVSTMLSYWGKARNSDAAGPPYHLLAYHSLEDRRVKRAFRDWATTCRCPPALPRCICGARARVRLLTRKVVTPSAAEVQANRRARSARLRAVEVMESAG